MREAARGGRRGGPRGSSERSSRKRTGPWPRSEPCKKRGHAAERSAAERSEEESAHCVRGALQSDAPIGAGGRAAVSAPGHVSVSASVASSGLDSHCATKAEGPHRGLRLKRRLPLLSFERFVDMAEAFAASVARSHKRPRTTARRRSSEPRCGSRCSNLHAETRNQNQTALLSSTTTKAPTVAAAAWASVPQK